MAAACSQRRRQLAGERGFTLIEVIVAVVLLSVAALALSSLLGGVAGRQAKDKIRHKQSASAEAIHERLRSEMSWTKMYGCQVPNNTCTINPGDFGIDQLLRDAMAQHNGVTLSARITAVGVDSPSDGVGLNADKDGIIPDFWRLTVVVNAESAALPGLKPVVMTSDVSTAASAETGSLLVRLCIVEDQIDQRIAIASCPARRTELMLPPEPNGPPPVSWEKATTQQRSMTIAPLRASYTVRGPGGTFGGSTNAEGVAEHKGLVPGNYTITVSAPGTHEIWASHSIPANGFATVEAGQRSQVLQVFKPRTRRVLMSFSTRDGSVPWDPKFFDHAERSTLFKMIAEPFGRTLMMPDWVNVPVGTKELLLPPMEPGLYSPYVMLDNFTIRNRLSGPENGPLPIFLEERDGVFAAHYELGMCDPDARLAAWKSVGGSGSETDPNNLVTVVKDGKEYKIGPTCSGGSPTVSPPSGGGNGGA